MTVVFSPGNTHHEDVGDGVQDDEDDLAVLGGEEVQQRLQDVGLHQVDHLLHGPPAGEVRDGPHRLLLGFIVTLQRKEREMMSHMVITSHVQMTTKPLNLELLFYASLSYLKKKK